MTTSANLADAARAYLDAGLCVLPARRTEKRPAIGTWKQYQKRLPTPAEHAAWFANGHEAICILCGESSRHLELLDFDGGGELFDAWWAKLPGSLRERLVVERSPSGGWHVIYRHENPVCGNLKLAQRKQADGKIVTLIETRGEGGLFLCAPTEGYELVQGAITDAPILSEAERDRLLMAAWELNEHVGTVTGATRGAGRGHVSPPAGATGTAERPGDDFNARGDVRDVLEKHGWVCVRGGDNEHWRRPGKESGTSATLKDGVFYVFSSNATPFESNQAYAPFAVYTLLEHGGDYEVAARALREEGYGGNSLPDVAPGVDISGIIGNLSQGAADDADSGDHRPENVDPGPIPEEMFHIPGFVADVMQFTLANAPYPNVGLAFCGALALQSFLCGRKVCDSGDLRPNLYLLALASSGTGKDFPRKVNSRVLFEIGQVGALGDKFASGEGIQDALARSTAMLFQNDEMDGVLRQINLDRESSRESIPNILLTLYTSANDVYPVRVKAGQKETSHIDQPHLTLFGTATPQYFYEALSQRMLTNGFFARLIIVDIGERGAGQEPGSPRHVPEEVLAIARWWNDFQPGAVRQNLLEVHPEPRVVAYASAAMEAIRAFQRQAEAEYAEADKANDEVARVAWSRTLENAKKLALLYACSENHEDPSIGLPAVEWATGFAMHQTRRQLYLAASYVAENPFHAECLKLIRKLRAAPGQQMARRELMRAMRCKAADFDQMVSTLLQQQDIVPVEIPTRTRPAQGYRLA